MRTAIYATQDDVYGRKMLAVFPEMFGIFSSVDGVFWAVCEKESIKLKGSFLDCILEQTKAMEEGERGLKERLNVVLRDEATELVDCASKEMKPGKWAIFWPGKRTYKVVGDAEVVKSDDEIEEVFDFNSFSDDGMRRRMVKQIVMSMRDGGSW